MANTGSQPPGWYYAQGDPQGTQRYWDGTQWQGGPQPVPGAAGAVPGGAAMVGGATIADGGKRIVARIIDAIIWFVISLPASIVLVGGAVAAGGLANADDVSFAATLVVGLINTALVVAYEVLCTAKLGGTPGKLALGMKIRKEDGSEADMNTAIMRMVPYGALGLFQVIPLIGVLGSLLFVVGAIAGLVMLFTDDRKQTPWDKVGKTIVVNA